MIRPTLAVSRPLIGKNSAEVVTGESTNFCRNWGRARCAGGIANGVLRSNVLHSGRIRYTLATDGHRLIFTPIPWRGFIDGNTNS
jgi:hypothetical protein